MLAIVWLFPVPGGPNSTKSPPRCAASTAATWEESADSGVKSSAGSTARSMLSCGTKAVAEPS